MIDYNVPSLNEIEYWSRKVNVIKHASHDLLVPLFSLTGEPRPWWLFWLWSNEAEDRAVRARIWMTFVAESRYCEPTYGIQSYCASAVKVALLRCEQRCTVKIHLAGRPVRRSTRKLLIEVLRISPIICVLSSCFFWVNQCHRRRNNRPAMKNRFLNYFHVIG